jgi:radical SAM protein with 4Fe4S-binding SPASM domain
LVERGIVVNMITNGLYRREGTATDVARRATDAGLCNLGVSIDGDEAVHDRIRGKGTFVRSMASVRAFAAFGMETAVLTTINRWNLPLLEEIRRLVIDSGATAWRLQLAKPMGSMHDQRELILAPRDLLVLMPLLARLKKSGGVRLGIGDSLGYYGAPDRALRNRGWRGHKESWQGCQAGMLAVGIEADGGVKGCLSMQAKLDGRDPFLEGNLREHSLSEIWSRRDAFAYNRRFEPSSLTGPCRDCRYGAKCRGGARCVSSAVCGKLTEDPFCYYRVARDAQGPSAMVPAMNAAAVALALTVSGCGARSDLGSLDAAAADAAPVGDAGEMTAPDAGVVEPDASSQDSGVADDAGEDPCCTLDYGVIPPPPDAGEMDAGADAGEEPCCSEDYGVEPPPIEPDSGT